jgi:bacterioferritin-associated ferredoxin
MPIFEIDLQGRDKAEITLEGDAIKVKSIGCLSFLESMDRLRKLSFEQIKIQPLRVSQDHASLLYNEAILKLRGEWIYPYRETELCHCRRIATSVVDKAIVSGYHSDKSVTAATGAGGSCGTCKPDIDKILNYRLNHSSSKS